MASAYQDYIQSKLNPILETLVTQILLEHPDDPIPFMISRLCAKAGLPDPTLGVRRDNEELKAEISCLRKEVKQFAKSSNVVIGGSTTVTATDDQRDSDESDASDDEDDEPWVDEDPDLKVRGFNKMRQSVSAEVYGEWNKKKLYEPIVHEKTDEQIARIQAILQMSFMFSSLDSKNKKTVIDAMQEKKIISDYTLIRQGADGDCLFVVESGELQCFRKEGEEPERMVKTVGPGDIFGELALLYNAPRAATVKSVTECMLWKLDRDTFNAIVKDAATKKRDLYDKFLQKVRLLESMSPYDRMKLADALKTEEFKDGEFIVREGESGDTFYFIEEGSAIATKTFDQAKGPEQVELYTDGDYFGELALITGEPRAANVIAQGNVRVASLERKSFKRLLGSVEELLCKKAQQYKKAPR